MQNLFKLLFSANLKLALPSISEEACLSINNSALLLILESIISIMIDFILKIIYLLIGLGYTINLN